MYCTERGVDLKPIIEADGFQRIAYLDDAAGNLVDLSEIDFEASRPTSRRGGSGTRPRSSRP